jgi:HPt (histidine-containing phosphotransfer) domain-containing protein
MSSTTSRYLQPDSNADVMTPILDLDLLRERCLGNESLMTKILAKLGTAVRDDSDQIAEAWRRRDLDCVATVSHRLKGTTSNVGAGALCEVASHLESAARLQDSDQAGEWMARLDQEAASLIETLERLQDNRVGE